MRFFYFDNEENKPVLDSLFCDFTDDPRYVQVFETTLPFYVETWHDKKGRREMRFATQEKPNSENATRGREMAELQHSFVCDHLVALDIPTKEFEAIIKRFDIIPIIID